METKTRVHIAELTAKVKTASDLRTHLSTVGMRSSEEAGDHIAQGLYLLAEIIGTAVIAAMEEDDYTEEPLTEQG